jgi:bifunctional non-homologous end joining protein LigD
MAAGRGLDEYRRKRSFEGTPEPAGEEGPGPHEGHPRFVIQEHSATRLHWDLRLEHEGALASWALPRGLPDDPEQNRLAVHTEDHPLEYLDFEGTIPAGNYGAGEMRIVDRGTYEAEKYTETKITLRLEGERIRGRFALFQTGKGEDAKNWMVHRLDPPDPGRAVLPETLEPMRATDAVKLPAEDSGWAYEIDWAGTRALGFLAGGKLTLRDGGGAEIGDRLPELRDIARQVGIRDALLDGVVVSLGADGKPDRERLARRLEAKSESATRRLSNREPVSWMVFDLLHLDGRSLLELPYRERREELGALGLEGPAWRAPDAHLGDGAALLEAAGRQGLDGVIAKRVESPYEPGVESEDWLRLRAS